MRVWVAWFLVEFLVVGVSALRALGHLRLLQVERYRNARFLAYLRANPRALLWVPPRGRKGSLAMTGRAWRILCVYLALVFLAGLALAPSAALGVVSGLVAACLSPLGLALANLLLGPVQMAMNAVYAADARARVVRSGARVVAVTGSYGKTTTKEALASVLATRFRVFRPRGSVNTPMGLAREVREKVSPGLEYLVVEMGAFGEGEIRQLARMVPPHVAVLTRIGPAHLERFGSLEAVARAKYELVEAVPDGGYAVFNADDPVLERLARVTARVRAVLYGLEERPGLLCTARDVSVGPGGTTFTLVSPGGERKVATRLLGLHNVSNLLAAACVGIEEGLSLEEVVQGLARVEPVPHRLELKASGGVVVLDDSYNSNPEGAREALRVLGLLPARRRILVTPGMVELGEKQFQENAALGEEASRVCDLVVVVGLPNREALLEGLGRGGGERKARIFETLIQASSFLKEELRPGDAVLFENDLPEHLEVARGGPGTGRR